MTTPKNPAAVNQIRPLGVLLAGDPMNALARSYADNAVNVLPPREETLELEFERRLADTGRLAFRIAYGVLRNHADAEDVAQEAFVRAYRNFHRLRDRDRFQSWLIRISWRLAIDRVRAAGRRTKHELAAAEEPREASVEDIAAHRQFRQRLDRAVDELSYKLRIVVILAAMEGHTTAEVARVLQIPEGTVKVRLHLARKKLAEKLR